MSKLVKNYTRTHPIITKEEFLKSYCRRSEITIEEFYERGLYVEECNCDYEKCKGWCVKVDTSKR